MQDEELADVLPILEGNVYCANEILAVLSIKVEK
jgi:hypothetical protein